MLHVKAFNMITSKNEAKPMTEHISCDFKCNFNSTVSNLNQKWNNNTCQCECKNYRTCRKDYRWNPSTCIQQEIFKKYFSDWILWNYICYGYCINIKY